MADDGDIRKRVCVVQRPPSFGGREINVIIYVIEWAPPFGSSQRGAVLFAVAPLRASGIVND